MKVACILSGHKYVCSECGVEHDTAGFADDLKQVVAAEADHRLQEIMGEVGTVRPDLFFEFQRTLTQLRMAKSGA